MQYQATLHAYMLVHRLRFLKHQLVRLLVIKNYLKDYKKSKDESIEKWHGYLERLQIAPDFFDDKCVLEVGSGHSAALFPSSAKKLVNLDPLMAIYKKYINTFPNIFPGLHVVNASAEFVPFYDNIFDIIVCVSCSHL